MKKILRLGSSFVLAIVLVLSLSGCQIFHLFWPQNAPVEVSEAIPEIPDEVLKEAAELEEAAEFFESITGEEKPLTVVPIGSFKLNYFLNYQSEYLNAKSSIIEEITLEPDRGQEDYTKATYYFEKWFPGKQTAEMAGMDEGVICWAMFEHEVKYYVHGTFEPESCTLKVTIEVEPQKTVELGSSCPHYVTGLLDYAQLFIATPDTEIVITNIEPIITFDRWHQLNIYDLKLPLESINCPMK